MTRKYIQYWTVPEHTWDEDEVVTIHVETKQVINLGVPKTNDPIWKCDEIRNINIIGRFISELFPNKNFEVKTTGTLEGVKYRIGFTRGGLSNNDRLYMMDRLNDISFYVSKRFGQVYHLDYSR